MPYKLHVVKTTDFVRFDGKGNPDLVESRRALERIAGACLDSGCDCALIDVRDVYSTLEFTDLYNLIAAFNAMGFRREHRLAILHRYTGSERAEFFTMCAADRGWNVRGFDNFEEAMEWFGTEEKVA